MLVDLELARRARRRVAQAREAGVERLFDLQATALERLGGLLDKAPDDVPVLSRVAEVAERAVQRRLDGAIGCPISDYDDLNAKRVRQRLNRLSRVDLLRLRRFEAAHKNRGSVLKDIDREIARDRRLPLEASPSGA